MRSLVTMIALAACASFVGSCATHYHARKPVSATLQIEVEGQWRTVQRTVYEYPEGNNEEANEVEEANDGQPARKD